MNTLIRPPLPASPMAKALTTVLGYRDAVGNDDWNAALDVIEANNPWVRAPFDIPAFLDAMHKLVAEARGLMPTGGDSLWHLDSIVEDLNALTEIHVTAPMRAEMAEEERRADVMENGTYAERRHEVLGDES